MRAVALLLVLAAVSLVTADVLYDSTKSPDQLQAGNSADPSDVSVDDAEEDENEFADAPWDEETGDDGEADPAKDENADTDDAGDTSMTTSGPQTIIDMMGSGDWDGILALAESGADVTMVNEYGEGPLHMASAPHNPQLKALKALIKAGADINKQDVDGCSPIIWAVHNNHYENTKALLEAGADITLVDVKGRVVKDHAMSQKMRSLFAAPGEEIDSGLKDLESDEFDSEVMKSEEDVVLYMYSPSCGYCRDFAPHYEELAAQLRPTSLKFLKMDVTKGNPPGAYSVSNLPSILLSKKAQAGQARPEPLLYDGKRSVKLITEWLQRTATNRFMFTAGGKEQGVPDSFDAAAQDGTEPVETAAALTADAPDQNDEL